MEKETKTAGVTTNNRFKRAESRNKKPAGGLPAEMTAGLGEAQNEIPVIEPEVQPVVQHDVPTVPETQPVKEDAAQTEPVVEEKREELHTSDLIKTYEDKMPPKKEPRKKRLQIVVTASTNEKLERLVEEGKIASKNDLVNFLLESYLSNVK